MADTEANSEPQPSKLAPAVILATVAICILFAGLLFVFVRQSDWTLGWIYLGLLAASVIANVVCLLIWNPVVLARRMVFHAGTKAWDHVLMMVFLAVFIAVVVVAVEDLKSRNGYPLPGIGWLIGLANFVLGWVLVTWSMVANPFFEKTVRIQRDHGHHVIDSGPYAYIRHPGYVGFSAVFLSTPFLLASTETFLPILIAATVLVIRTALEDRTLQDELPGYREYSARIRYRLIPGLW
jgi:protein-S-isoprenylcysteine O-methyltransferase Ste14